MNLQTCRQGELAFQRHPSQEWATCHFVLTHSRFLHWFSRADALDSIDGLRLARCQVRNLEGCLDDIVLVL